ncbi:MAG TPA: phage portal protein [Alphaproteobacteria bacterium]|nr:phage portal protein [Alphaproteobacteria bacterium]
MRFKIFGMDIGFGKKDQLGSNYTFDQIYKIIGGGGTLSGAAVNYETALKVAAVYGCIRVRAEDIGKLPFKLLQTDNNDGRRSRPATDHPLYKIISRKPNGWQTSQAFREALQASADLMGGGYAIKWFKNLEKTELEALIPVLPGLVETKQRADLSVYYRITMPGGSKQDFAAEDIFHLPGLCLADRESALINGTSLLKKAAEVMGLSLTSEEYLARQLKNGSAPPGILSSDTPLTKEQAELLKELWEKQYGGPDNAGKIAVLFGGLKYSSTGMNNREAQRNEADAQLVSKICAFFRVHPNKIFAFTGANPQTYASAAQFSVDHRIDCIMPMAQRWMQAVDNQLLTDEQVDKEGYYSKIFMMGLLEGDPQMRWDIYKKGREIAVLSPNDVLSLEDMPLSNDPGMDDPFAPLNTNPLPALSKPAATTGE